jgi:hypothetical protein
MHADQREPMSPVRRRLVLINDGVVVAKRGEPVEFINIFMK